jgi:hypothetical protein
MLKMMMIEVKAASLTTVVFLKHFIEPQGQPELLQFSQLSTLNSEECSSATAIDLSIKNTNKKN